MKLETLNILRLIHHIQLSTAKNSLLLQLDPNTKQKGYLRLVSYLEFMQFHDFRHFLEVVCILKSASFRF